MELKKQINQEDPYKRGFIDTSDYKPRPMTGKINNSYDRRRNHQSVNNATGRNQISNLYQTNPAAFAESQRSNSNLPRNTYAMS